MIDDRNTRVLLALLHTYERDGRATFRSVSPAAGLSLSTTHAALVELRAEGLVTWDGSLLGTLRPTVKAVQAA